MDKTDFKKEMKSLYSPGAKDFVLVDVPRMQFLMVDGMGDPNTAPAYANAVEALYSVSYALKFMSKKAPGRDYAVMPLEGLWWADDMTDFTSGRRDGWRWTMMIMQPDWITSEMFAATRAKAAGNLGAVPDRLRLEAFDEGLSAQILHIGPYSAEAPTIARLHNVFLPENGLVPTGHHHEIYLGDPRKSAPEKLRTILRQPVRSKA